MSATDVDPSRLAAAQQAASTFIDRVPEQLLVGFVGFGTQTNSVIEPTLERAEVKGAIDSLQADGGTATGDALNAALDRLEARKGKDGAARPPRSSCSPTASAPRAATRSPPPSAPRSSASRSPPSRSARPTGP